MIVQLKDYEKKIVLVTNIQLKMVIQKVGTKNKVDRSNVPEDVSIKMSDNFINLVSKIEDLVKDWKHKYVNINIEIEYIN